MISFKTHYKHDEIAKNHSLATNERGVLNYDGGMAENDCCIFERDGGTAVAVGVDDGGRGSEW